MDAYYRQVIMKLNQGKRLTQEERIFVLIYGRALQGLKTPLPMVMDLRIANHTARLTALHKMFPGMIKNNKWKDGDHFSSEYFIDISEGQLMLKAV